MRSILNSFDMNTNNARSIVNSELLEVDEPLNLVNDVTLNLGGLSSYGTTGQVMKVNADADGLVWEDDDDTTYTVVNPLTLSNQNAISLTGLSGFGEAGQVLRVATGATGLEYSDETVESANTPLVITNGVIKLNGLSGYGGGIGQSGKQQLIRTNANASALEYFDQPDFINSATLPLSISSSGVISLATTLTLDRLNMTHGSSTNAIFFKGDNDLKHYIKYVFDGVEIGGFGSNDGSCFKVVNTEPLENDPSALPLVLAYYFRNYIQFEKDLWLNQKAIYFYLDVNGLDRNHYIKYDGRSGTLGCNGVQVGGYGSGNRACFEVVNTQPLADPTPGLPIVVFQVCPDKVISNQKLFMQDQPVYLRLATGETGADLNHYIKYQSIGDCVELASYSNGGDDDPVFKFVNSFNSELLVSLNRNKTVFSKDTFFSAEVNAVSLIVTEDITCRDITASTFMTTPQLNVVNTSSTGTLTANNITLSAVDKHIYFTPDLFNYIKATSTDVTGGGMLITGYDTVRLSEHVNSNRYAELHNDSFTIAQCNLVVSDYNKAFFAPKATFADSPVFLSGRASICNTRIVNANGLVQIDCGRTTFSATQSIDGMAIRKGTGGHLVNFVKYDNTGNLGQIRATNTNVFYDQSSDRRLKTNITDMRSMIDKIMELRPREYNWIADNESDYGFIAQEVHETFPHMREDVSCYCCEDMDDMECPVNKDGEPIYFGVDYGRFTPYLVKAMQEQQAQIDRQQAQIDDLIRLVKTQTLGSEGVSSCITSLSNPTEKSP